MSLYLDSAYVAKCYLEEPDARRVRALVEHETELYSSAWSRVEMACIFHRNVHERRLSKEQALLLQDRFRTHVEEGLWMLLPITEALLGQAETAIRNLAPQVFLRAGDAIHLITARDAGQTEIWSNDRHLLKAAPFFGLRGRTA